MAGGIVTLVWHPDQVAPGDYNDPIPTATMEQMVDPATAVGAAWRQNLARAAAVLQRFENAGVPVLFRPLHEQTASSSGGGTIPPRTGRRSRGARRRGLRSGARWSTT